MRYDGPPWTIADAYDEHKISTGGACHGESETEDEEASQEGGSMEWNSDDDGIIDPADDENDYYNYYARYRVTFLGFHPYKEVVFLGMGNSGVACHLDTGKVQDLGVLDPGCYNRGPYESFVYTPCLMGV